MSSEQDISCIIFSGKKKRGECITIQPKKSKTPKRLFLQHFLRFFEQYYFMIWFNSNCNASQANFPFIVRPYLTFLTL